MDTNIIVAIIGIVGVILTICGTMGGTVLGTHLTKRASIDAAKELAELERSKYTRDRLWDARKDTYAAMIASLSSLSRIAKTIHDGFNDGELHPEFYYQSDSFDKASDELWLGYREAVDRFDNGRLVFSDEFYTRFQELMKGMVGEENDLPPERYENAYNALSGGMTALLKIARREISPDDAAKAEARDVAPF